MLRDLTAGGLVNADAGVVQQSAGGAIQLDARFFVSRHRRTRVDSAVASALWYCRTSVVVEVPN